MTTTPLPKPYALAKDIDAKDVFSEEYAHWTVADVIEMLQDHDPNARVWIADDDPDATDDEPVYLRPLEIIFGSHGEVIF